MKDKRWPIVVMVALLVTGVLAATLPASAGLAQDSQPVTAGEHGRHGMMHGPMMHGMLGGPLRHGRMHQMMRQGGMRSAGTRATALTGAEQTAKEVAPGDFAKALAIADAARGQELTMANACTGCHSTDDQLRMVGPTWHELATTAATRVEGQDAASYLYTSIVQPNAYVVPGYQANVMIQSYGRQLDEQDLADIVKYLLTLD